MLHPRLQATKVKGITQYIYVLRIPKGTPEQERLEALERLHAMASHKPSKAYKKKSPQMGLFVD